ncbi:MAG: hypothetical protein NUV47_00065, partial [Patescibacteria group bacterium]|nr:hypothetical protein [Patescibacteria group bacterium]
MGRKFLICVLTVVASFGTTVFAETIQSNQVQVYLRPYVTCIATPSSVLVGDTVTWTSDVRPTGQAYSYSWSSTGATLVSGNTTSASYVVKYGSTGSRSATVTVTPIGITSPLGSLARTVTCSGNDGVQVNELPGIPTVDPSTPACNANPGKINLVFGQGTGGTITDYYLSRSPYSNTNSGWGVIQHTNYLADLVSPDANLTPGATYQYQLMARGPGGDRYSSITNSTNSSILCDATINSFTATSPVVYNTASTLTWTTSNMSSCGITADKTVSGFPKTNLNPNSN